MARRVLSLLTALVLLLGLAACGKQKIDVGVVVHAPDDADNHFIRGSRAGMEASCQTYGKNYGFFEPEYRSEEAQEASLEQALDQGAKVIIFPSFLLGPMAYHAQEEYPDIKFILVDGVPNNDSDTDYEERLDDNTCSLLFDEAQAGFLAGYAAVKDGFTKLGFFGGMALPPVIRFGTGYIQGAEFAAKELGMDPGSVEMRYVYCGTFTSQPEYQTKAAKWYWEGTEVIFGCGGGVGHSVMQAAKGAQDAWVIGVDADQSHESDRVITSAVKQVAPAIEHLLDSYFEGDFPGGTVVRAGVADDGVGLAMENARFRTFGMEAYQEVYQRLIDDTDGIASGISDHTVDIQDLPLTYVDLKVEAMK